MIYGNRELFGFEWKHVTKTLVNNALCRAWFWLRGTRLGGGVDEICVLGAVAHQLSLLRNRLETLNNPQLGSMPADDVLRLIHNKLFEHHPERPDDVVIADNDKYSKHVVAPGCECYDSCFLVIINLQENIRIIGSPQFHTNDSNAQIEPNAIEVKIRKPDFLHIFDHATNDINIAINK